MIYGRWIDSLFICMVNFNSVVVVVVVLELTKIQRNYYLMTSYSPLRIISLPFIGEYSIFLDPVQKITISFRFLRRSFFVSLI